jgi:hypothetical protein
MKIKLVAMTGADEQTDVSEMIKINKDYPFAEWAVLMYKKRVGETLYPAPAWVANLSCAAELRLAGHLCGEWAAEPINMGKFSFPYDFTRAWTRFGRIQFNYHPKLKSYSQVHPRFFDSLEKAAHYFQEYIIQINGEASSELHLKCREYGLKVGCLHDDSAGHGNLPESWSYIPASFNGFAGGLTPDNLQEQLKRISDVAGKNEIWIDAQTGLQTDGVLDLKKCRKFLKTASKWT